MANVLSRYGIKEVADVTFYKITEDTTTGAITVGEPVLYLDTLKVSTIEQTSENTEARGGKGNAALVAWDYGKEITVTLEDALYSPKSMALIYGGVDTEGNPVMGTAGTTIKKTVWRENVTKDASGNYFANLQGNKVAFNGTPAFYKINAASGKSGDMELATESEDWVYATGEITIKDAIQIDVSASGFPGTYYITGDTYARSDTTGKDEYFQFIIPKAKVLAENNTITLEAEGDPTVFNMSLKVLRPKDGVMMKLVQYSANN